MRNRPAGPVNTDRCKLFLSWDLTLELMNLKAIQRDVGRVV